MMVSRLLFPAIEHVFVTFSSFGDETCHVRKRPRQMSVNIMFGQHALSQAFSCGMKRLETVLFVMDSIRKITSRRSNGRQFDKGIGDFHVRSPEPLESLFG